MINSLTKLAADNTIYHKPKCIPEYYTRYTKYPCFVFLVSLFVYFNIRKYIMMGLDECTTDTRKYFVNKRNTENTKYTKYRKIGLLKIYYYFIKF